MGNKAQTAKALVQQADEALIVISEYWMQTIDATGGSEKAAEIAALEAGDDGDEGNGKLNEAEVMLSSAKLQLKTSLMDITAALLGRNVSQATKKDRRATPEEKQEIADLITEGLSRESKKKADPPGGLGFLVRPGLVFHLIKHLNLLDLESKKAVVQIVASLVRENDSFRSFICVGYDEKGSIVSGRSDMIDMMVNGFEVTDYSPETGQCLHTGAMLQVIVRNDPSTAKYVLDKYIWKFLTEYVKIPSFDIQVLSFDTLRDLLLCTTEDGSKTLLRDNAAKFINNLWEPPLKEISKMIPGNKPPENRFFHVLNQLMVSQDHFTVKHTVKLMQSVLFDPKKVTFESMLAYVGDARNLKVAMNLLRDDATSIQFEGFHLFKVFVLNPNCPNIVKCVLARNKEKMCNYLESFQPERRTDDQAFAHELASAITTIQSLDLQTVLTAAKAEKEKALALAQAETVSAEESKKGAQETPKDNNQAGKNEGEQAGE